MRVCTVSARVQIYFVSMKVQEERTRKVPLGDDGVTGEEEELRFGTSLSPLVVSGVCAINSTINEPKRGHQRRGTGTMG